MRRPADASRWVLLLSMVGAVALLAVLASRGWHLTTPLSLTVALLVIAARLSGQWYAASAAVLLLAYVTPVLIIFAAGRHHLFFTAIWIAALVAVVAPSRAHQGWSVPNRWLIPLQTWALVTATAWLLIALRETEFDPSFLHRGRPGNSSLGVFPAIVVATIAYAALVHGLGLLWFDALFRRFRAEPRGRLYRMVLLPLALGAACSALLGAYQAFGNLAFLSAGGWSSIGRSAGASADANVFGMISAMWVLGFLALACAAHGRVGRLFAGAGLVLCWVGMWTSGSRTALLAALIGIALVVPAAARAWWHRRSRWLVVGIAAAVVLVVALTWFGVSGSAVGPLGRLFAALPASSRESAGTLARELWNRNFYGLVSTTMVQEHPLVGVGIGTFSTLVPDYGHLLTEYRLSPDNAQNWYRHQLAELGVLGSLGWLAWVTLFCWALRPRVAARGGVEAAAIRGALVGFGVASLVGMAGQDITVVITFWTFAFWYVNATDQAGVAEPQTSPRRSPFLGAAIPWAIAAAFVVGTLIVARADLRLPFRAARFDYDYSYGLHRDAQDRFLTAKHAVMVPRAPSPWLKLTYWVEHPDADANRVQVDIWRDREHIVNRRLSRDVPVTEYVTVPGEGKRFVLEVRVDRTFRPGDSDGEGSDERGLMMKWEFVEGGAGTEP